MAINYSTEVGTDFRQFMVNAVDLQNGLRSKYTSRRISASPLQYPRPVIRCLHCQQGHYNENRTILWEIEIFTVEVIMGATGTC